MKKIIKITHLVIHIKVGLALISGIFAWFNRRGGCTRKSRSKPEFEDYGLADTDFPHNHTPAMQNMTTTPNVVSPTIPRLNEQGNFYTKEDQQYMAPYQMSEPYPGSPEHQPYYYQGQQQPVHDGGYYDENGYYYESTSPHQPQVVAADYYPIQQQQQQQQYYPQTDQYYANVNYYKPDQVTDNTHHA